MDAIVRQQGPRTQYVTSGGDDYVYDAGSKRYSGILDSAEEAKLASGALTLDDIICDEECLS